VNLVVVQFEFLRPNRRLPEFDAFSSHDVGMSHDVRRVVKVFVVALMLCGAFITGQYLLGTASAQSRPRWEYQVVKIDRMDNANPGTFQILGLSKLGEEGWEAVGMNDS
jgi:hypothetical protein